MKSIQFPQQTTQVAENQKEYTTLPSCIRQENVAGIRQPVTVNVCCFELDDIDIHRIIKHRKIWHRALTFGGKLQPFNIFAVSDYFDEKAWLEKPENTEYLEFKDIPISMSFKERVKFLFKGKRHITIKTRFSSFDSNISNIVISKKL